MNIALIGYGKMGHEIERIALERGHSIALKVSTHSAQKLQDLPASNADVAIEFTRPDAAAQNVQYCLSTGVPVVCGTTGWDTATMVALSNQSGPAFLTATNFSVGVNIFFEINLRLAALMNRQPAYEVSITETHHTQKKDAPSGTAITLANGILENLDRKTSWAKGDVTDTTAINIDSFRRDDVPGTHNVRYRSAVDDIEIIHTAHNRSGFALGAVLAAEFIAGKKGVFTMQDVLGL